MSNQTHNATLALVWALDQVSPSEVVNSKTMLESYHNFLRKATPVQFQQLCVEPKSTRVAVPGATVCKRMDVRSSDPNVPKWRRQRRRVDRASTDDSFMPSPACLHPCQSSQLSLANDNHSQSLRVPESPRDSSVFAINCSSVDEQCAPMEWSQPASPVLSRYTLADVTHDDASSPDMVELEQSCSPSPSYESGIDDMFSDSGIGSMSFSPMSQSPSLTSNCQSPARDTQIVASSTIPSGPSTDAVLHMARAFFERRLASRKSRVTYLLRATRGFLQATDLPPDFCENIWGSRAKIFVGFEDSGSVARFCRLHEGHCRIKQGREEYAYADRLCYIFLEHDFEQLVKSKELVVSKGRGRKTAAFEQQADTISSTINAVRFDRKVGRGYVHLLKIGGPGFLLRLGSQTSTIWERKLSKGDIFLVLEFLRGYVGDIYAKCMALNTIAAQTILSGFIAYGWSHTEILSTNGPLIDTLKEYWAIGDPTVGPEVAAVALSPENLTTENSPADLFITESTLVTSVIGAGSADHVSTTSNMEVDTAEHALDIMLEGPNNFQSDMLDSTSAPFTENNEWWNTSCNFQASDAELLNCYALEPSWNFMDHMLEQPGNVLRRQTL